MKKTRSAKEIFSDYQKISQYIFIIDNQYVNMHTDYIITGLIKQIQYEYGQVLQLADYQAMLDDTQISIDTQSLKAIISDFEKNVNETNDFTKSFDIALKKIDDIRKEMESCNMDFIALIGRENVEKHLIKGNIKR